MSKNAVFERALAMFRSIPFISRFFTDSPRAARLQLDVYACATYLKCYDWQTQNRSDTITKETVLGFITDLEKLYPKGREDFVNREITRQLLGLFQKFEKSSDYQADKRTDEDLYEKICNYFFGKEEKNYESRCLLDFSIHVQPSSISGAGEGLFIKNLGPRKHVATGSVIAIFPGEVHLKEYTRKKEYVSNLFPDPNFQLTLTAGGHLIDSRQLDKIPQNPIALAHKVNHVPEGKTPNVIAISYGFPAFRSGEDGYPYKYRKYIPNVYAKAPFATDRTQIMRSKVLVTSRPIADGEEIFMDYRLTSVESMKYPVWYIPYVSSYEPETADRS